ncbi:MAG TPA: Scr1 family TA system antitoxin-like transcriptional regulator [Streptosporangiaceae bacterium]|nr:Scr1 family TA system antitoxin-like transcriptional regulator [Streptosporangiaceae bacterium]
MKVSCPGLGTTHVRALAALTARRQELLHRDGFALHAILDQAALLRPPAGSCVMAGQLSHLAGLAARPNITLQVLPLTTAWPILSPPFTLLGFPGPGDPDTACTVSHNGLNHLTRDDRHVQALCGTYAILSKAALPADTSTLRRLLRR